MFRDDSLLSMRIDRESLLSEVPPQKLQYYIKLEYQNHIQHNTQSQYSHTYTAWTNLVIPKAPPYFN